MKEKNSKLVLFTCNRVGDVRGNVKNLFDRCSHLDVLIEQIINISTKNSFEIIVH